MTKKNNNENTNELSDLILTNIKKKVKANNITKEYLAKKMFIDRSNVFARLSGKCKFSINDLPKWANALDCSVCDLLYDPYSDNNNICTEAEIISNKINSLPPKHKKLMVVIIDLICRLITLSNAENRD